MKTTTKLNKYVELFKRNIQNFLAPGVQISSVAYPVEKEGAVFEFILSTDGNTIDRVEKVRPSVGNVLSEIPQRMVAGNLEGIRFGGTNLYLEGNRILVIKGENKPSEWTGNAVINDVQRVVSTSQGGRGA